MELRRVVVTGVGALSCLGNSVKENFDALTAGRCGLDAVNTGFDLSEYRTRIGGQIKNFDPSKYMSVKDARHQDIFVLFAVAAADEALNDSGFGIDFRDGKAGVDPTRVGVCLGSGIGGMKTVEEQIGILTQRGPSRVSPFTIPMMIADMASGYYAIRTGAQGPNFTVLTACSTATHCIGESFNHIRLNKADVMIAGGSEAPLTRLGFAGFCSLKALSQRNDDPQHASRPFDRDRDGFVMAEGAGVLVLEEYEHARKRGAKIYGEIVGYGATADAYHITCPAPGGEGGARAIKMALDEAGLNPSDIDYINAHGTSTVLNDKFETAAIKSVFGNAASSVAISSTKGSTGHTLGAAGALETIFCLKAMETGIVPPTINYENPDPECDLDYTPNQARERKIEAAININLGFGGHNGVLAVKKIKE